MLKELVLATLLTVLLVWGMGATPDPVTKLALFALMFAVWILFIRSQAKK